MQEGTPMEQTSAARQPSEQAARLSVWVLLLLGALLLQQPVPSAQAAENGPAGADTITLHFFWTQQCPRCIAALPAVRRLAEDYDWLEVRSYNLSAEPRHGQVYRELASALGEEARAVPGFVFCDAMLVGFDDHGRQEARLRQLLETCHAQIQAGGPPVLERALWTEAEPMRLPLLGEVRPDDLSLPALTLLLAGFDAFNPCAFFVLLFLLSVVVHSRSRGRILLIGGIFVTISGVIYFTFMTAWLNAFLVFGEMPLVTRLAGLVAVTMALINIKDYFWFKRGVSLSIPDSARPGLFRRMRALTTADSLPWVLGATLILAVVVNLYEILCTMGFPMIYTRILTAHDPGAVGYYGYLLAYNVIYVLPMLIIVALFAFTLGNRKLQEDEGRLLKLLSGMMMLGLGLMLLLRPDLLANPLFAVGVIFLALLATGLVRRLSPRGSGGR
ncbi:conserved hypothetical protein [Alkalilimnicola ehrlichii MLHE-1]|uniref:Thioredoxin domain-containing protein n=2 Tax=Alkalilimnicola ehrlichii TaxID=351052 RepID=Q0A544_ALKEH|nr:conserved hypothetical protein [Alkalilimnicola ehrlichii MLHE-1]